MSLPRLSIKTMMGYFASTGILMVAVAHPDLDWITFLFIFHGILLLTAILGIILRSGRDRAFWIGFALFGWVSFLVGTFAIEAPKDQWGLVYLVNVVGGSLNDLADYLLSHQKDNPSTLFHWFLRPGNADRPTRMIDFSMVMALVGGQIARSMVISDPSDPPPTTSA